MSDPKRILIVRPSALGDVARTVGVLVSLKRAYPKAEIDWLVNDVFADAVVGHPDLHEVIGFPRKRFSKFGRKWSVTKDVFNWLNELKTRGYDAVYDMQGLGRSGLFTWWTRSGHRVGDAGARELGWLGYNKRVKLGEEKVHTVDRMMGLLEADGVAPVYDLRLHVPEGCGDWLNEYLAERGLEAGKYAVFAPTAAWVSKRWPIEQFVALAGKLPAVGIEDVVVVGGPGEEKHTRLLSEGKVDGVRVHDLVGKSRVGEMMGVISEAGLVVCNDSAAAHIAVGFERRMVCIFGPTDPAKVGPWRYDNYVVGPEGEVDVHYRQSELDQTLIGQVSVARVWACVERAMGAVPPKVDGVVGGGNEGSND